MKNQKLTPEFCLREIANNMAQNDGYGYIRIGRSLLHFVDVALEADCLGDNIYEVIDWDDNKYQYNDLLQAVFKFIAVQPK